jgi:hypothetical protein
MFRIRNNACKKRGFFDKKGSSATSEAPLAIFSEGSKCLDTVTIPMLLLHKYFENINSERKREGCRGIITAPSHAS